MHITLKLLKRLKACTPQVAIFASTFPEGVEITEATTYQAAEAGLNLNWLATVLFEHSAAVKYLDAVDGYLQSQLEACRVAHSTWVFSEHNKRAYDQYIARRKKALETYNRRRSKAFYKTFVQHRR